MSAPRSWRTFGSSGLSAQCQEQEEMASLCNTQRGASQSVS